jgi:hypothetical protein
VTLNFQMDKVLPNDPAGFGGWRMGHFLEHGVFSQKCAALSTPVIVPEYDILSWRDEPQYVKQWLSSHEAMHQQIRFATNVTGADLALVDFSDEEQFLAWMDDHAEEHLIFREVLGVS